MRPPGPRQDADDGLDLPLELLERAVVADHVGGSGGLLLLGELAVAPAFEQLGPTLGCSPRSGPVGGDHGHGGVEHVLEPRLEQQRHLDDRQGPRGRNLATPLGHSQADQRVKDRLEPRELFRALEHDLADPLPVHGAIHHDPLAPALGQPRAHLRVIEQLVGKLVRGERRRPEPRERAQRLRLAGRDPAGQSNEGWCVAVRRRNRLVPLIGFGRCVAVRRRNRLVPLIGFGWCVAVRRRNRLVPCRSASGVRAPPEVWHQPSPASGDSSPSEAGSLASASPVGSAGSASGAVSASGAGSSPASSGGALREDLLGDVEVRDLVRRRLLLGLLGDLGRNQVPERQILGLGALDAERDPAATLVDLEDPDPDLVARGHDLTRAFDVVLEPKATMSDIWLRISVEALIEKNISAAALAKTIVSSLPMTRTGCGKALSRLSQSTIPVGGAAAACICDLRVEVALSLMPSEAPGPNRTPRGPRARAAAPTPYRAVPAKT